MNDPIEERLRSYYRSIQRGPSAGLEMRVGRGFDLAATAPSRPAWRPAFGLLAAGAAVIVVALVARGLVVPPAPEPSGAIGPTASASSSATATPETTASAEPTDLVPPPTDVPGATPPPTATPSPSTTPSPAPTRPATSSPIAAGSFVLTGSMTAGRDRPTATLLGNGKVLVAGGRGQQGSVLVAVAGAELYSPATGKFTATGSMSAGRWGHTATLLKDGRVLIAGGADLSDGADNLRTAELYDPATGKFTATGSMSAGRAWQTATLLADGRVLIAGGTNSIGLGSAEIYDPSTGSFTATGPMTVARQNQTATRLADGRVLIAGGIADGADGPFGVQGSAEVYDPGTGSFTATGSMASVREGAAAALLADGSVLIAGGRDQDGTNLSSAEVYNPATGKFHGVGAVPSGATVQTATRLAGGSVLAIGATATGAAAAIYDPGTAKFRAAGTTKLAIGSQTATVLPDGRVLLLGGLAASGRPIAATGLYRP